MKRLYLTIGDILFNDSLDFRAQIFNTLGLLGLGLGLIFAGVSAYNRAGIWSVIGNLTASAVAVILIWRANRTKNFKRYFLISVILVFLIIFPVLFFAAGGYHSGMPCFFIFAIVFTVIMLEGGLRTVFTVLEFTLYVGCFLTAYLRPELITRFPTEAETVNDIIAGCLGAAAALTVAIHRHIVIYDRKQNELSVANGQLQGLSHMKTEFLQNISHELKTPLTVICNYALDTQSELRQQVLNVPEMEFNQNRIRAEGERLKRMVSQLLDVTAIEGGRTKIAKEPLTLATLISRMADANTGIFRENGNRVELHIPDSLPDVLADRDAIEQVMLNLISNAARHTQNGVITISLSEGHGWQEVRVLDTGEGIPQKVLDKVFLRYVERESRVSGRSGLGLYICKKHIDAHGGKIGIESAPYKGTAVWFRLPASEAEDLRI